MVGRDQVSAKPTIMFFCEDKEPRKRSKKIVNEGGLLRRLPGFRTGHRAKQPGIGLLVQPATNHNSVHNEVNPIEGGSRRLLPPYRKETNVSSYRLHISSLKTHGSA
jgi:hypothetical protein